jgi:hypothetical protein
MGKVKNELAVVEEESAVVGTPEEIKSNMGFMLRPPMHSITPGYDISDQTTHWKTDMFTLHR